MSDTQQAVVTPPEQPQQLDTAALIKKAVALRDIIAQKNDEHAKAMKPYNELMEQLKGVLLGILINANTDKMSAKDAGTISKNPKTSATVEDTEALWDYIIKNQAWHMVNISANKEAVETYIKENNGLTPPGVKWSSFMDLSLRRPSKSATTA